MLLLRKVSGVVVFAMVEDEEGDDAYDGCRTKEWWVWW